MYSSKASPNGALTPCQKSVGGKSKDSILNKRMAGTMNFFSSAFKEERGRSFSIELWTDALLLDHLVNIRCLKANLFLS